MNLQQLIYFRKIAELQHYTKAAEELHITQPCLSHAISELESELGRNMENAISLMLRQLWTLWIPAAPRSSLSATRSAERYRLSTSVR